MAEQWDAIVYKRSVELEVVVPKNLIRTFIKELSFTDLGKNCLKDDHLLPELFGLNSQFSECRVVVVFIEESQEDDFYDFMLDFCERYDISWRDPRNEKKD